MQRKHVFGQTILANPFLDIYKCPFLIFPKYFPKKKHDISGSLSIQIIYYKIEMIFRLSNAYKQQHQKWDASFQLQMESQFLDKNAKPKQ